MFSISIDMYFYSKLATLRGCARTNNHSVDLIASKLDGLTRRACKLPENFIKIGPAAL